MIGGQDTGMEFGDRSAVNLARGSYRTAAWVGIGFLALAVVVAMVMGQWWGVLMLVAFLVTSVGFVAFEDRLPSLFDLLFVAAALVNALGWLVNLYSRVPGYDEGAHAFTLFAITLSFGFLAYHPVRAPFRPRGALDVLAIASFGLAVGALWEIVEWLLLRPLPNPIIDLMMDAVGALAAGLLALGALRYEPRQRRTGAHRPASLSTAAWRSTRCCGSARR